MEVQTLIKRRECNMNFIKLRKQKIIYCQNFDKLLSQVGEELECI